MFKDYCTFESVKSFNDNSNPEVDTKLDALVFDFH